MQPFLEGVAASFKGKDSDVVTVAGEESDPGGGVDRHSDFDDFVDLDEVDPFIYVVEDVPWWWYPWWLLTVGQGDLGFEPVVMVGAEGKGSDLLSSGFGTFR